MASNKFIIGSLAAIGLTIGASAAALKNSGEMVKTAQPANAKVATAPPVLGAALMWPQATTLGAPVVKPAAVTAPKLAPLLPLDLSTMRLWNWGGKWIGSEWNHALSPLPWKHDHIKQPAGADTLFILDAAGSAELQEGGPMTRRDGLWETEVTLPRLRDGLVVAPLWLYDPASRDEIDFEFAGRKGLDVSMHVYVNGVHKQNTVRLFAGTDMSGQRKRFGIKLDQKAGYAEMYVDGKRVHRWDRSTTGYFVSHPVKPWIELWAADPKNTGFVYWVGKWTGLAKGEALTMRVHGYGYTDPAGQMTR